MLQSKKDLSIEPGSPFQIRCLSLHDFHVHICRVGLSCLKKKVRFFYTPSVKNTSFLFSFCNLTFHLPFSNGQVLPAHILIRACLGQCHLRILAQIPKSICIPCPWLRCPGPICRPCHGRPPDHSPHPQERSPASLGAERTDPPSLYFMSLITNIHEQVILMTSLVLFQRHKKKPPSLSRTWTLTSLKNPWSTHGHTPW